MKIKQIVSEKALSKQHQKFMGMVYAAKKGAPPASPEVAKAAAGMSTKAARDFAATKHKGLPQRVSDKKNEDATVTAVDDKSVTYKDDKGVETKVPKAMASSTETGEVKINPAATGAEVPDIKAGAKVDTDATETIGRIKELAGMKEQDPNPAPGAPTAATPPTQGVPGAPAAATPPGAPAEDDDGPVPPIESKEAFVKFFLERNPDYAKPENKAMLEKLVAVDTDGTVDLETSMANMMRMFASELAPGFVEMFEHLGRIIEEAIADPEFAQLTPQEQADLKDALTDIKKKLPEMRQEVAKIQAQVPELDAVVAQRKAAGLKNFASPATPQQQMERSLEDMSQNLPAHAKSTESYPASNDTTSAITGGEEHDEITKLLVPRLRKLAGL